MKGILTVFALLALILTCSAQQEMKYDSVDVRVLNKGNHYIKHFIISANGIEYTFDDIRRKKYSDYQKLPYLWTNNKTETEVIVKKVIRYDQWMKSMLWPVDHVGETKYLKGSFTVEVKTKVKSGQLEVDELAILE
jgi:hypothetical protein